ncbi:MAG: UDP-N-acetylmuramoyl-L-alanine--D-glutamate ligase [Candidatus Omnitrophica bacterium]|nr:UDP-N-acetylmuramoyl-L-alanine--D-glutamate ligase [Candidatus Omnitrophota bacterium]
MKEFKGKKAAVLGAGRSGLAAAALLKDAGADVFVSDLSDSSKILESERFLAARDIEFEFGKHSKDRIKQSGLIVISPGISGNSDIVKWADGLKIPIISEIELGYLFCKGRIVAVTGTNGKTTVTTLIGKVISAAGYKCFTCGNIGRPFCADAGQAREGDFISLEVSSFQLERTQSFKPRVAVMLNISPDHMDRYRDIDEYFSAKKKIYANQGSDDFLILNYDDPLLAGLAGEAPSRAMFFRDKLEDSKHGVKLNPNHFAVMAAAEALGIPEKTCMAVFREFKGVEHRLEAVRTIRDILFINDSKATNVDSAIWALKNLSRPAVIIAGGRDKNCPLDPVLPLVRQKVKHMVLIGEATDKFYDFFKDTVSIDKAGDLEGAVRAAYKRAAPGDCVILSPMCASFDMFDNYEHRGRVFKEIVNKLT